MCRMAFYMILLIKKQHDDYYRKKKYTYSRIEMFELQSWENQTHVWLSKKKKKKTAELTYHKIVIKP